MKALTEPETRISLAGAAAASAAYAMYLDSLRGRYAEEGWTWATVVLGVAMTGGAVALRLTLPTPQLTSRALLWWSWRQWTLHFIATGIPIVVWQLWADRRNRLVAERQAAERRYVP